MDKVKFIEASLLESAEVKKRILSQCTDQILKAVEIITNAFRNGKKLLLCGNGGSAADSQHIATEFVIRLNPEIKRPGLPAIAITTDTSNLTAGGNDIGFENTFARTVEALGNEGDVLIGISTSGNSENVIRAIKTAKEKGMKTIGLLGRDGGKMKELCDLAIIVPSNNTQRIQEGHITIGHIISELVEMELYKSEN
ncbi:phosphoheptose isomerase [Candidatus Kryptonium thompsonii]|jgi:D-sedoheptulose 7-phosphate isomerase|uniref:Phosphoheptose isomerase n=1 Tax=Candidatus Kryptonium thompsonii TaxID=1633631 RepID=A0A0P1L985_9BACT|nr:D-sedoheptulose 7-phosphate isomerase [Candidatus Kryptonium thompsoni]CUS77572.1 phosphoheptose isomerase [Candidatus Kryptonium thompsoni]CUS82022.1 phosphoheptose isomerase [Candidatus Kryptonium thompsoni]CUS84272.1 phosphoheptose isomerase [Candidatus Kryptonium thompsoni]CUS92225.1 phosphoheptose isomerase [Candidatus Kryptonium thompsoni]CUS92908.1 phosphoheptose isomerase [Candidatus Kryptonium thompsoni]